MCFDRNINRNRDVKFFDWDYLHLTALMKETYFKGQLISEQIYAVLNFPKMQRNIARISTLASKMSQIKKVKAHYHPN